LPATLEIRFEADPATPAVSADAVQIHQVLMNLCTNAWHAVEGRSQPRLDIMLAPARIDAGGGAGADLQPGLYARLSVRDNGIGMEPLVLERIFEPFFTTKPTGLGTGLGLSVVHGIVENHGGAIRVESRPGEGSAFHLYFPAEEQEAGAPEPASPRQALPAGSGERVLYIDDEEAMALLVERSLERLGYRVTASTSPAAALAAFRARPGDFDVAVTDYHMPAMNGRELIQALRGVRNDLPIVVTTGFLRPEDAEELRRLGIQELVQKPDTVDGLIQALHRIFARLRGRP
jgi:CheY-like chemotaxis protein